MDLIQQGKEEDAEVFIGNSTQQRNGLNMVSDMLEGHLQKIANITLEWIPSQATELLVLEERNTVINDVDRICIKSKLQWVDTLDN